MVLGKGLRDRLDLDPEVHRLALRLGMTVLCDIGEVVDVGSEFAVSSVLHENDTQFTSFNLSPRRANALRLSVLLHLIAAGNVIKHLPPHSFPSPLHVKPSRRPRTGVAANTPSLYSANAETFEFRASLQSAIKAWNRSGPRPSESGSPLRPQIMTREFPTRLWRRNGLSSPGRSTPGVPTAPQRSRTQSVNPQSGKDEPSIA